MRDAAIFNIYEGTGQIQREIVSRVSQFFAWVGLRCPQLSFLDSAGASQAEHVRCFNFMSSRVLAIQSLKIEISSMNFPIAEQR